MLADAAGPPRASVAPALAGLGLLGVLWTVEATRRLAGPSWIEDWGTLPPVSVPLELASALLAVAGAGLGWLARGRGRVAGIGCVAAALGVAALVAGRAVPLAWPPGARPATAWIGANDARQLAIVAGPLGLAVGAAWRGAVVWRGETTADRGGSLAPEAVVVAIAAAGWANWGRALVVHWPIDGNHWAWPVYAWGSLIGPAAALGLALVAVGTARRGPDAARWLAAAVVAQGLGMVAACAPCLFDPQMRVSIAGAGVLDGARLFLPSLNCSAALLVGLIAAHRAGAFGGADPRSPRPSPAASLRA